MLKKLISFFHKRKPTLRERNWKCQFEIGSHIQYLGVKGIVIYNHDLYESKTDGDEWDGEAFVTMRYVDNSGRFGEIDLNEFDLFGDVEEV